MSKMFSNNMLRCNVIVLPTDKPIKNGDLVLFNDGTISINNSNCALIPRREPKWAVVYLVAVNSHDAKSPDYVEIKENDFVIWNNSNTVEKVKKVGLDLLTFESTHLNGYIENCKKIIATSDESLGLPVIQQAYIKAMVEQNNAAITDRDVTVEIVDNGHEDWFSPSDGSESEPFWNAKIEVTFKK